MRTLIKYLVQEIFAELERRGYIEPMPVKVTNGPVGGDEPDRNP